MRRAAVSAEEPGGSGGGARASRAACLTRGGARAAWRGAQQLKAQAGLGARRRGGATTTARARASRAARAAHAADCGSTQRFVASSRGSGAKLVSHWIILTFASVSSPCSAQYFFCILVFHTILVLIFLSLVLQVICQQTVFSSIVAPLNSELSTF